ncbi:MAG: hypothetical protein ACJ8B6_04000, partial [Gemmatimonadales bacterium]
MTTQGQGTGGEHSYPGNDGIEPRRRTRVRRWIARCGALALAAAGLIAACNDSRGPTEPSPEEIAEGKTIFRFDTFGDETFWTDTLRMHEVVQTVPPTTALAVGLKVDADTLPAVVVQAIQAGQVNLNDPATTVTLLKLGAVVGLKATVDANNRITRLGITCALCHSTVDDRITKGIGSRRDGWPNLDLNPGAIIALSPALTASQKAVYNSWGAGRYDARFNFDGLNGPTVIPPAYGLDGVNSITFTGDGTEIAYWNRYVGVTQMHGHGSFSESRLGISVQNQPD